MYNIKSIKQLRNSHNLIKIQHFLKHIPIFEFYLADKEKLLSLLCYT